MTKEDTIEDLLEKVHITDIKESGTVDFRLPKEYVEDYAHAIKQHYLGRLPKKRKHSNTQERRATMSEEEFIKAFEKKFNSGFFRLEFSDDISMKAISRWLRSNLPKGLKVKSSEGVVNNHKGLHAHYDQGFEDCNKKWKALSTQINASEEAHDD